MTDNPNEPDIDGNTPIYLAARRGHTEIVKFLSPLIENPNKLGNNGETAIHAAARKGYIYWTF